MVFDLPLEQTCLFFDVDGSLIDIAPRPNEVVVPPALIDDLQRASAAVGGALALVSGRSIAQLDHLFAPALFAASGVHGAEMRFEPGSATLVSSDDELGDELWIAIADLLAGFPGTFAENKRFSFAVHYRANPAAGHRLREELRRLVELNGDRAVSMMPGHYVYEIKRATFNKGVAVRRFLGHPRFAGRKPVFIGDDVTDQPGFAVALDFDGQAYSVGTRFPGTTGAFSSPSDVRHWVAHLA